MIALGLRARMIADYFVVKLSLTDCRAVKSSPAIASRIEPSFHLVQDFSCPLGVKPSSRGEMIANTFHQQVRLPESGGPLRWIYEFALQQFFDWKMDLAVV